VATTRQETPQSTSSNALGARLREPSPQKKTCLAVAARAPEVKDSRAERRRQSFPLEIKNCDGKNASSVEAGAAPQDDILI